MAKTTTTSDGATNAVSTAPEAKTPAAESRYKAAELAASARTRFNAPPEAVLAAMKAAGKNDATLAEAQRIVTDFMTREVL
jgi:hypothetical protein